MVQVKTPYRIKADWLETCNCDPGCHCNFGGIPDYGSCEAIVGLSINQGNFGDVDLSGVKVVLAINWPKAIFEGNGVGVVFIDESASESQVQGLGTILKGQAGGMPWEFIATTISSFDGPVIKPIQMDVNGTNSGFSIDGILEAKIVPLKNPVTGEEKEVHIVHPKGGRFWNDGDCATTSVMNVNYGAVKFDHSGKNGIFSSIEWSNH